jgi:predicted enzyme related to lactoylglutathione lyase
MQRVTGIGGIFFKAKNPEVLRAWYQRHLGVAIEEWGGAVFRWHNADTASSTGSTVWNISEHDSDYYAPSQSSFMINYRVANVTALLQLLRDEGCEVLDASEASEFGTFGWVLDPEGNKIELWQPPEGQ